MSDTASAWAPLRSRIFRALFVAQLVSNLGSLMQTVGAAWLMGDLGGSRSLVALTQAIIFVPVVLIGIPAGVMADLFDRRRLLIFTHLATLLVAGVMALMTFTGSMTPNLVLWLTFALGFFSALIAPAWAAIQPDLVPKEQFAQGVALSAMTFNVGRAVGPALGGLIIAAAGPGWVFLINAISFVGTMLVLWWWKEPPVSVGDAPAERFSGAMVAGLRYCANSPLIRGVLARVFILMLPGVAVSTLMPIVVRGPLHWSAAGYGILLGCFGVGATMASVLRPRVIRILHPDAIMVAAAAAVVTMLLVQGFVTNRLIVAVTLLCGGFVWSLAVTTSNVAAQAAMPAWVRARGMALYTLVLTGAVAVGGTVIGVIANGNLGLAHVLAAIAAGLGGFAGLRWPLTWAQVPDLTLVPGEAPIVAMEPGHDDGPVLVTVTYLVPAARLTDFGDVMGLAERHRRRTGAFRWRLYRDLAEPDRFVETFLVASWAEHLRQHHRTTVGATELLARMKSFVHPRSVGPGHYLSATSEHGMDPHLPDIPDEQFTSEEIGE